MFKKKKTLNVELLVFTLVFLHENTAEVKSNPTFRPNCLFIHVSNSIWEIDDCYSQSQP